MVLKWEQMKWFCHNNTACFCFVLSVSLVDFGLSCRKEKQSLTSRIFFFVYLCIASFVSEDSWEKKRKKESEVAQSCPTLCNPVDCSLPGSSVHEIFQVRVLEWVAISFSNAWKWKVKVKVKSRLTLSNPMGSSLPGFTIHGIFQARELEWGAIAFSVTSLIIKKRIK